MNLPVKDILRSVPYMTPLLGSRETAHINAGDDICSRL